MDNVLELGYGQENIINENKKDNFDEQNTILSENCDSIMDTKENPKKTINAIKTEAFESIIEANKIYIKSSLKNKKIKKINKTISKLKKKINNLTDTNKKILDFLEKQNK